MQVHLFLTSVVQMQQVVVCTSSGLRSVPIEMRALYSFSRSCLACQTKSDFKTGRLKAASHLDFKINMSVLALRDEAALQIHLMLDGLKHYSAVVEKING